MLLSLLSPGFAGEQEALRGLVFNLTDNSVAYGDRRRPLHVTIRVQAPTAV